MKTCGHSFDVRWQGTSDEYTQYGKCPKISNTQVSDKMTYADVQTQIRLC